MSNSYTVSHYFILIILYKFYISVILCWLHNKINDCLFQSTRKMVFQILFKREHYSFLCKFKHTTYSCISMCVSATSWYLRFYIQSLLFCVFRWYTVQTHVVPIRDMYTCVTIHNILTIITITDAIICCILDYKLFTNSYRKSNIIIYNCSPNVVRKFSHYPYDILMKIFFTHHD